ncbi:hypothetical protein, partial [Acidisphaera sp. L21]|uniref:hypothetical protein n=1 Tax=Acidisphaera sp. L21 TaxID=1641851 RepID=UPI001C2074A9
PGRGDGAADTRPADGAQRVGGMTHLGFIVASYALAILVPIGFAVGAARRLSLARRRLAAIDPRAAR